MVAAPRGDSCNTLDLVRIVRPSDLNCTGLVFSTLSSWRGVTRRDTFRCMGMFNRSKSRDAAEQAGADMMRFFVELETNPPVSIAKILASYEHPIPVLAHTLLVLLEAGRLKPEDVELLGIDAQELERIAKALDGSENVEQFQYNLSVGAAMGVYERQIGEILQERGAVLNEVQRDEFRTRLATFAHDNDVRDLKLAYRLMRAEGNDPLPGLQAQRGDVGYL